MPNPSSDLPAELKPFTRTIDFLSFEGFSRLRAASVTVIGLGGVGSHAAVALARSGVGRLRLIDMDLVSVSSLNRSAFASADEIGRPKAEALKAFLLRAVPSVEIDARVEFFHEDTADALLDPTPEMVIDAIDSYTPKVALLRICQERRIPVVACLGASARSDPTLLRTGDLLDSRECPLARKVRARLRQLGVGRGIQAVWSVEPTRPPLDPDESEETYERGRKRKRLPSLIVMPGIFGYTAAGLAIRTLAREKDPVPG